MFPIVTHWTIFVFPSFQVKNDSAISANPYIFANGDGNGHSGGVALNGGHTHQGYTDVIGKMCFNPP
jgi:hypothetical protein